MDDMYLIHESKNYLKQCLNKIIERYKRIGLKINITKTKITRLDHGLVFLKGRYSLLENGKILCRPLRASTLRMARRLRKLKALKENGGRITYRDIYDSYQSWRSAYRRRFNAYQRVRRMDGIYNRLFINTH